MGKMRAIILLTMLLGHGSLEHDDKAASFLAVTNALEHLQLLFEDGSSTSSFNLIESVAEVRGDRIYVHLNLPLFSRWKKAGAKFLLSKENGKIDRGHFRFNRGDLGGS